jgi:hypothetical protein
MLGELQMTVRSRIVSGTNEETTTRTPISTDPQRQGKQTNDSPRKAGPISSSTAQHGSNHLLPPRSHHAPCGEAVARGAASAVGSSEIWVLQILQVATASGNYVASYIGLNSPAISGSYSV